MILADVFPVFCPQVFIPSSQSSWSKFDRPSYRHPTKMSWSSEKHNNAFNTDNAPNPFARLSFSSPLKSLPFPSNVYDRNRQFPITNESRLLPAMSPTKLPERISMGQISLTHPQDLGIFQPGSLIKRRLEVTHAELKNSGTGATSGMYPAEKRHFRKMSDKKTEATREIKAYRKHGFGYSKKLYTCPQCKYVTDRKNNLKRHITTMHQDCSKVLECCGMVFRSKASLRDHVSLFHRSGYRCQYCGRNFCRKALLRRHLTVHSGQKDFTCPQCGYATSHKSNLERHRKIHGRKYPINGDGTFDDSVTCSEEGHFLTVSSSSSSDSSPSPGTSPEQSPRVDARHSACNHDFMNRWVDSANGEISLSGNNTSPRCKRGILSDRIRETHGKIPTEILIKTDPINISSDPEIQNPTRVAFSEAVNENGREIKTVTNEDSFVSLAEKPPTNNNNEALITSSSSSSTKDHSERRQIRRKPFCRMFMRPYKCYECSAAFSHQTDLNAHECKPERDFVLSPPISVVERRTQQKSASIKKRQFDSLLDCEQGSKAENTEAMKPVRENDSKFQDLHRTYPQLPLKKCHLDGKDYVGIEPCSNGYL